MTEVMRRYLTHTKHREGLKPIFEKIQCNKTEVICKIKGIGGNEGKTKFNNEKVK